MKIARTLTALALWSSLAGSALAQTMVSDPSGFRTQVPAGYTVAQDASGVVASNAARTSAIVMKAHNYANFAAFAQDSNLARDGFALVGEPRSIDGGGGYFRASKPKPGGGAIIADTFITFSPRGGGCLVVALSDLSAADAGYYAAFDVVKNLQFTQPASGVAGNAWDQALRGKHLIYLYTGNGYSERFDLFLFANGSFVRRTNMSSTSMNGVGSAGGNSDGNWQIAGSQLILSYHDGRGANYTLAPRQAGNEVSLNGQRYFVTAD